MAEIKCSLGDATFVVNETENKLNKFNVWNTISHFHASYELHVVLNGSAVIEIDEKEVIVKSGEVLLIAPKFSHQPKGSVDSLEKTHFSFILTRNYSYNKIGGFSEYVYYDNIFKSIKTYKIFSEIELVNYIREMLDVDNTDSNQHVIQNILASFFIKLAKFIKGNNLLSDNQIISDSYESEKSLKKREIVEHFFQRRYSEQIGIEDLAKSLCLSVPQTHRIVKKIFSVGFKKILTKQRIEHACTLIKAKNKNLEEISILSGYTSYNGFLSAFKSYMGKTPKEYEKSIK